MSAGEAGRSDSLRAAVLLAVADLDQIHSVDPAAARAIDAVRLTSMTLEDFWLPFLDELDRRLGDPASTPADTRPA